MCRVADSFFFLCIEPRGLMYQILGCRPVRDLGCCGSCSRKLQTDSPTQIPRSLASSIGCSQLLPHVLPRLVEAIVVRAERPKRHSRRPVPRSYTAQPCPRSRVMPSIKRMCTRSQCRVLQLSTDSLLSVNVVELAPTRGWTRLCGWCKKRL